LLCFKRPRLSDDSGRSKKARLEDNPGEGTSGLTTGAAPHSGNTNSNSAGESGT